MKQLDEGDINQAQEMMAPPSTPEVETDECMGNKMPPKAVNLPGGDEVLTGECGGMEMPSQPKQQDNVTMNVSMNGSGAGGIKNLMNILRNIEQGASHDGGDVVLGVGETQDGGFGDATTSPDPQVAGIAAMTRTGNDLASKGKEAPKMNGGGNPMQEALARKLSAHYNEVKSR